MSLFAEKSQNIFSRENLAKETLDKMWKYANKGQFCDVILIAAEDGKKIAAHRAVLSAMNEFFETMFGSDFKEADEKEVLISDISGDILEAIIGYCYTGTININEDNALQILPQASLMLFPEIVEACSVFLISTINPSNCLSLAKYAKLYNIQALLEIAEEYAIEHFVNVSVTEEFLKLRQEDLEEYLAFEELNVENEKDVFEALMKWINHDVKTRSCSLSKLLPLISMRDIEHTFLLQYILNNHNYEYHHSLLDGIKENLFNQQNLATPARARTNQIVFVCSEKLQIYNLKRKAIEFTYIIPNYGHFKPTLLGEKLILVFENLMVQSFDLNTKTWRELSPTSIRKYSNCIEVLNECIYVVGGIINGIGNSPYSRTVERWDSNLNQWSEVKAMHYPRSNFCTAIANGKLYAIGGYTHGTLNSVESYDPITNEWSICSSMFSARQYARAVAVNDEIFVFGGYGDNSQTLNCIEKYNPETNKWIRVSKMSCKRQRMGAYLLNKKIYLVGGCNENGEWLRSIEEFNPAKNVCKLIDTPNIKYKEDLYCFPYSICKNKI